MSPTTAFVALCFVGCAMVTANDHVITVTEGEAIGSEFMDSLAHGFKKNDFSDQHNMFADEVSWEWSGGVTGSGSRQDYYDVLANTWQPLVSSFQPSNTLFVVDTERGIISIPHELVINIDGRGNGPTCLFHGKNVFELHVNADKEIVTFRGLWDSEDQDMNRCIASASGPNLVDICSNAYLNFQSKGEYGTPLNEFWSEDAILDPKFPVQGWTRQDGREAILNQINHLNDYSGLAGFSVEPYNFERIGNRVFAFEHITTDRGASFDGLAIHTFNDGGECVRTDTYHDSAELKSGS
jgi:hypothetical protein